MTFALTPSSSTSTSVTLTFAGLTDDAPSTPDVLYLQVSPRSDFQFCVCPTYTVSPVSPIVVLPINPSCSYYFRAKRHYANGTVDADWTAVVGATTPAGTAQNTGPQNVMIEPAIIVIPETFLAFADQQGGTVSGFPMENLGRDSPVAWRSGSSNSLFQITFNIAAPIDVIALLQTTFLDSSSVVIRGGSTKASVASGTAPYTSASLPFRASSAMPGRNGYHGLFRLPSVMTYPWWSLTITGAQFAGMCQAEHLIVGRNMMSKNHSVDKNETASPLTTVSRNRSGSVDRVFGRPMRKVDFDISMLSETQYETIYGRLWQQQNNPILVVPNSRPGAFLHDRILYGDFAQARTVNPASPRYSMSLSVNSIV